jgi:hypothetical protein
MESYITLDELEMLRLIDKALVSTVPAVVQCREQLLTLVNLAHSDEKLKGGCIDKLLFENTILRVAADVTRNTEKQNFLQPTIMKGI